MRWRGPFVLWLLALQCEGKDITIGIDRKPLTDAGEEGFIPPRPCPPCSADLHAVIDCEGHPKLVCPPELACAPEGTCVNPCDGAAASSTTLGCDFFAVEPDVLQKNWQGACHALLVANAWEEPTTITLERDGLVLDAAPFAYIPVRHTPNPTTFDPLPNGLLMPRQMAVVLLGGSTTPCGPGLQSAFANVDLAVHGTGRGKAVRIRTSRPVALFDLYPWTPTPDPQALPAVPSASLLFPTSTWQDLALGVTGWPITQGVQAGVSTFWSALAITATSDATLSIFPLVDITGGPNVSPAPKNASKTYPIAAGEVLQLEQLEDLSGTIIRSSTDKIAVWGTHQCMTIPSGNFTCDAAHQQLPPSTALGSEYVAVRYRSRAGGAGEEAPPWRFVGLADNTILSYDPPMTAAPMTLRYGQTRTYEATGPFTVWSQNSDHAFFMSAHMTSYGARAALDSEGDPESVILIPSDQWLTSYRFAVDPTYRDVQLVVVRKVPAGRTGEVNLDCVGPIPGFAPVGGMGKYEYAYVDLVRDGKPADLCDFGAHVMSGTTPFTATVWAMDKAVSYAYPVGAALRPINGIRHATPTPQ
jgi:hypothetical protein